MTSVILVDDVEDKDDTSSFDVLGEYLSIKDINVYHSDPESIVESYKKNKPDVVLVTVFTQRGINAIQSLRKHDLGAKIISCSENKNEYEPVKYVDHHIDSPYEIDSIIEIIEHLLEV